MAKKKTKEFDNTEQDNLETPQDEAETGFSEDVEKAKPEYFSTKVERYRR